MADRSLRAEPLTAEAFAPYGDVLEVSGPPDLMINEGRCGRYHDRAKLAFDAAGRPGLSLFAAQACMLPHRFDLLERHPLGSQAFVPLSAAPFLVIVAPDLDGRPGAPLAFVTTPGQGVNYHRGTWHGVLTPLWENAVFAVLDRIGPGTNLQEHRAPEPWTVIAPDP